MVIFTSTASSAFHKHGMTGSLRCMHCLYTQGCMRCTTQMALPCVARCSIPVLVMLSVLRRAVLCCAGASPCACGVECRLECAGLHVWRNFTCLLPEEGVVATQGDMTCRCGCCMVCCCLLHVSSALAHMGKRQKAVNRVLYDSCGSQSRLTALATKSADSWAVSAVQCSLHGRHRGEWDFLLLLWFGIE
jgi:hypothetical protein